ncbi:lamin tail domain-containing protein [Streptomyces sp. KMM 9044]|uniref:lamin tail domain-containing protein n=1 Tax=Streptomyces sp. KMM 9044 TaxID=2744474 RepID=UPI0021512B4A|nr:lamin tail domain-containing protein [Streptomyces sp. KMM 9044]WAX76464.1 lamin tail domain-containing protein [Streptomyces sp. KMM 9044]
MRIRTAAVATTAVAGALATLTAVPAHAAEYTSALKVRGVQYDAPGRDSNKCFTGNTHQEYLTVKNYSPTKTVNLKGYVVEDTVGNRFVFEADHYLQLRDYVKLRGGSGSGSGSGSGKNSVVYRDNCNFIWNNDKDTIYPVKPTGSRADAHAYTKRGSDRDGNGYISFHK